MGIKDTEAVNKEITTWQLGGLETQNIKVSYKISKPQIKKLKSTHNS